ncbi:NAD(P)/FAD-dependent oxidoreductase [Timonella sp. A28]|uniref:NAD(P)/FAD-dependent oxidoreductase n=1 Tax=Timonella sp. A28 TaxID=3442640 RepID=UPI003EBA7C80
MATMSSVPTLPPQPIKSVIVVGAGLAGLRTVDALRTQGFRGHITVVSNESLPPYDRPPLSKKLFEATAPTFLSDDMQCDLDQLADVVEYDAQALTLDIAGAQPKLVISQANKQQHTQRTLTADALVIAVGAPPQHPSSWTNVHSLYTWNDAQRLRTDLPSGSRLTIIGAGWIGCEVASVAAANGYTVTVIEAGETPLAQQLGPKIGARIAPWFNAPGLELRCGERVTGVQTTAAGLLTTEVIPVSGDTASLPATALHADVVLAAVGVSPATQWLDNVLTRSKNGAIYTNALGLASTRANSKCLVFAVGDCALRSDAIHGQIPGGHWNTALTDPEVVAATLCAIDNAATASVDVQPPHIPTPTPHVFSTQFGHDLNLFGTPDVMNDEVIVRSYSQDSWTALYVSSYSDVTCEDPSIHVTGIFTVNAPRDAATARRFLSQGPVTLQHTKASDPHTPLKNTRVS